MRVKSSLFVLLMVVITQFNFGENLNPDAVVQKGHSGEIIRIEYTNDGKNFLTESDGIVKLWDLSSGSLLKTYSDQYPYAYTLYNGVNNTYHIARIKFNKSSDVKNIRNLLSEKIAYSVINFLDYKTGIIEDRNNILVKHPVTNEQILGFDNDKLLNNENKTIYQPIQSDSSNYFYYCTLSPDYSMIVACNWLEGATLFDLKSGKALRTINSFTNRAKAFFSKDGNYFALIHYEYYHSFSDSKFTVYKKDGTLVYKQDDGIYGEITAVSFLNDDENIAVAGIFKNQNSKNYSEIFGIKIFNYKTGKYSNFLGDQGESTHSNLDYGIIVTLAVSPDNKYILSGTADSRITKWDIKNNTGTVLSKFKSGNFISAYSSDKSKVASILYQGTQYFNDQNSANNELFNANLMVWDFKSCKNTLSFRVKINTRETPVIGISYDGNTLVYGKTLGKKEDQLEPYHFLNLTTGKENTFGSFNDKFRDYNFEGMSFSDKSNIAAINYSFSPSPIYMSSETVILDLNKFKILNKFVFPYHPAKFPETTRPTEISLSPDEKFFATLGRSGKLDIFDTKKGIKIKSWDIPIPEEFNTIIGYSNDGTKIFFNNGLSSGIIISDVKTGKELKVIDSGRTAFSGAFSDDDKLFIECGDSASINLYETQNWAIIKKFEDNQFLYFNNIDFMPNNNFFICRTSDNSFRIWNIETKEWATFLKNSSGDQWIVYNSDGYWDSSENGGDLVTMVNGLECWNIDQFAVKNNRPDLIYAKLPFKDDNLITHYKNQYLKRLKKLGFVDKKGNPDESLLSKDYHVPETKIVDSKQIDKFVDLKISFSDSLYLLKKYNIFVNDVPIFGAYGKDINSRQIKTLDISEKIELTAGQNKIEVSCMNEKGTESYRSLTMASYTPSTPLKPDLYYIGFGVSKYKNSDLNLLYADKDAKDLASLFGKMKNQYTNIHTNLYLNEECTVENVRKAKDFLKNAKPDDTFVLFIAGHGIHDTDKDATYYYITHETDINNLSQTAANFEIIEDILQEIPPRNKLFLMDTCESGEIDDDVQEDFFSMADKRGIKSRAIDNARALKKKDDTSKKTTKRAYLFEKDRYIYNDLVRRSGTIVFSSCKGGEFSYESEKIGNGFFTSKIIESLKGETSDIDKDGRISIEELKKYVSIEVPKLADGKQNPTVDRDNIYQKFGFQSVK